MRRAVNVARVLSVLMFGGLLLTAEGDVNAQQATAPATPQQATPEGYVPRGTRPVKGLAPGMKVTDLGKGARTYRINMTKGDEIMSGLTDFAEKYHIKNGHFTAVGAINKGLFGWSDVERGLGQKKIELNQEAEIVSLIGSISVDSQGRSNVHGHGTVALSDGSVRGGHWFEAHVSIIAEVFVTEEEGAPESTPPLGPDGHPDLQGVWLNNSATPLERPKALEGRQSLTDQEVVELRQRADRLFKNTNADFAAGDAVFLAALANIDTFKSTTATGTTFEMIERDFDNRTSLIVDPPDGRIPSLTAEGQQRRAATTAIRRRPAEGPEDLNHVERCLTYGVPRLSGTNTGAGPLGYYQIVQTPSYIVLFLEAVHEARIINMDGRPHLPPSVRQWEGDSRGRWEGTTLVVDTTNFSARSDYMGSSDHLHLVERLTRVAPDRIDYQITVDDPTMWTKPWTAVIRLKQSAERLYEYACHEGNYEVLRDIFAGARASEKIR